MNKNKIEITIDLQSGLKANLELSPENYKQNFRDFRRIYEIGDQQALRLKTIIQLALVQISKMKFQTLAKTSIDQKQPKAEIEQHNVESPRFKRYHTEQQQLKPQLSIADQKEMAATEKKEIQRQLFVEQEDIESVEQKDIQQLPIISVKDIKNTQRSQLFEENGVDIPVERLQNIQKIQTESEKQHQEVEESWLTQYSLPSHKKEEIEQDDEPLPEVPPLKLQNIIKYEATMPTGLKQTQFSFHSHRKTQSKTEGQKQKQKVKAQDQQKTSAKQQKKEEFKEQKVKSESGRIKFDRLYYQQTDSFKSKKNQQIDRKQLIDFIEVQKYDLNNRLKRTNKDFFYQLHNRTTECWELRKASKSKEKSFSQSSKNYSTLPIKKVSLEKAFKGSLWESRSRCQAHIYQEKLSKQKAKAQADLKAKQALIRARIKKQKSIDKSSGKKPTQYNSRSCQKCSPKKVKTPKKAPKLIFKSKQKQKKCYISNILIQAYEQRMQQMKGLNIV